MVRRGRPVVEAAGCSLWPLAKLVTALCGLRSCRVASFFLVVLPPPPLHLLAGCSASINRLSCLLFRLPPLCLLHRLSRRCGPGTLPLAVMGRLCATRHGCPRGATTSAAACIAQQPALPSAAGPAATARPPPRRCVADRRPPINPSQPPCASLSSARVAGPNGHSARPCRHAARCPLRRATQGERHKQTTKAKI